MEVSAKDVLVMVFGTILFPSDQHLGEMPARIEELQRLPFFEISTEDIEKFSRLFLGKLSFYRFNGKKKDKKVTIILPTLANKSEWEYLFEKTQKGFSVLPDKLEFLYEELHKVLKIYPEVIVEASMDKALAS